MKDNFDLNNEDKNNNKLEDKPIKKQNPSKKGFVIFLIGLLMIGISVGSFVLGQSMSSDNGEEKSDEKENNDESNDDGENENQDIEEPSEEEHVEYKDYIVDNELVELSSLSGAVKLYDSVINSGNDDVKYKGYDGYYVVNDNGIFYLKRNQREVSKIEKDTLKIYKDSTDANSKYIAVACDDSYCRLSDAVSEEYAYLSLFSEDSVILDVNTGKNKIFDDAYVNPIEGIDKAIFTYDSIKNPNGQLSIVSLDDFSLKSLENGLFLVGNSVSLAQGDPIYSRSNKYIVVKNERSTKTGKYGVYDYQLNKKIDLIYDDLNTITDDLLIAKKDNKFGVIDYSNNTVIDFIYDGIEYIDGYYVVIKDNKLGVLNKNGSIVVPFNYSVSQEKEFSLRPCCGDMNVFSVYDKGSQILIMFFDSTRPTEGLFGCLESYLILNKDGTYSKVDFNTKIYGFSKNFYYYNSIENGFNLYDVGRNLYKTIKCDGGMYSSPEFVYRNVLKYSCDVRDTEGILLNTIEHYYNVKTGKEVSKDDVRDLMMTEVTYGMYIYAFGDEMGVYNSEKKLLLKLDNGDMFTHLYKNFYKNVKVNGSVEYYQLIS